nr:putative reverse transcriptase domain-containing protein [Tanacetum cinerariifolium]
KANIVVNALSRKEWMKPRRVRAMSMTIHSSIKAMILKAHSEASKDINTPEEMTRRLDKQFERKDDGRLVDKMYYDLRDLYWWSEMKKDIALYVSKCLTCSIVKTEHQKPSILLQQQEIPECKGEKITMDFITKLLITSSEHDTIWVIVDHLTKSTQFLAICEHYKMERFARLYINEIISRHGVPMSIISYRDCIHDTFHVSNMKKCLADVNLHAPLKEIKIDNGLCFVEEPTEVIDRGA